jgi:RHS repeat-associated protein
LYLGGTASYSYDAEGQRVRKAAGAAVEEYVYDSAGHQFATMQSSGAMERIELYAGARHLATYDIASNATYFIHGDWQGTERLRTNAAGAAYESCTNLPFGDNQTCTGGADISPMHFTGKPRDTETNLDYFGARYYNSGMARWMSPDWAAKPATVPYAQFGNPQSLNLYGYVTDNPVSRQDGDGHLLTIYQLYSWHSSAQDMSGIMMAITGEMQQQRLDEELQETKKQPPAQPAITAPHAHKKARKHIAIPQAPNSNLLVHLMFNEATANGISAENSEKEMAAIAFTAINTSTFLKSHPKYKPRWLHAAGTSLYDVVHASGAYGGIGGPRWNLVDNQKGLQPDDAVILMRAVSVAEGIAAGKVTDPYGGKEYGMRTGGSGSPGKNYTELPAIIPGSGNDFYTTEHPQ